MAVKLISIQAFPQKLDNGGGYYAVTAQVDTIADLSDIIDVNDSSTVWTYLDENMQTVPITADNVKNIHIVTYLQFGEGAPA